MPIQQTTACGTFGCSEPDMLILANYGWNFNVRNPNPGGNHGSFFRISAHFVFMLA
jgi:hypothetical protein